MFSELKVYWTVFKACLLTRLEYRGDVFFSLLGGLCFQAGPLLGYAVLYKWAPQLGGWSSVEILFLFGLWAVVLGLSELFFNHIWDLSEQIVEGSLDRLMVYPVHKLPFYLICSPTLHSFANILTGSLFLIYCGRALNFSPQVWLLLPYWAACGVAIYTGLLVMLACLSVLAPSRGLDLLWLAAQFNWASRYPLNIYPAALRVALLTLPPLGAYHYLPGLWLFKGGSAWQGLGAPLGAALGCAVAAVVCWELALNRYESTGS